MRLGLNILMSVQPAALISASCTCPEVTANMAAQAVVAQLTAAGVDPAMLQNLAMQPAPLISDPSGSYTTNTNSIELASGMCLGPTPRPCRMTPIRLSLYLFRACCFAACICHTAPFCFQLQFNVISN